MGRQLTLLPPGQRPEWKLDEHTRRVGRKGVAEVREILRRTPPPAPPRVPGTAA